MNEVIFKSLDEHRRECIGHLLVQVLVGSVVIDVIVEVKTVEGCLGCVSLLLRR